MINSLPDSCISAVFGGCSCELNLWAWHTPHSSPWSCTAFCATTFIARDAAVLGTVYFAAPVAVAALTTIGGAVGLLGVAAVKLLSNGADATLTDVKVSR